MSEMLQNWIIGVSVMAAAGYLVYRFIRWRHRRDACGDCKLRKLAMGEGLESTKKPENQATD